MEINDSNLLLYLKGDNFTDSSTYKHTIINHGATISTTVKKTGTGSMENFSSGSTRVEIPYNKIFDIGTGDFTVEFWINVKSFSTDTQLVSGNIRNALFVGFNTGGCFGIGRAAVAWVDDAMLIDLTECFGSGNEPDKTWCDSNIPYFEKTYIYGAKLSIKTSAWEDLSNGLIKIPTIPQTYTPLEYIEGTGTQYINTGITPTQNTSFSFGVYMKEITGACIIGCIVSNDNNDYRIFNYNRQIYWDMQASRLIGIANSFPTNQKIEFEVGNNYVKKDEATVLTGTMLSSFTGDCPIQVLRDNPTGSSTCAKGRVYYLKIYNSGTLVRNMLPCKNENGVIGMYDTVEKKFYNNNGTGTFIAGPKGSDWKYFKKVSIKKRAFGARSLVNLKKRQVVLW